MMLVRRCAGLRIGEGTPQANAPPGWTEALCPLATVAAFSPRTCLWFLPLASLHIPCLCFLIVQGPHRHPPCARVRAAPCLRFPLRSLSSAFSPPRFGDSQQQLVVDGIHRFLLFRSCWSVCARGCASVRGRRRRTPRGWMEALCPLATVLAFSPRTCLWFLPLASLHISCSGFSIGRGPHRHPPCALARFPVSAVSPPPLCPRPSPFRFGDSRRRDGSIAPANSAPPGSQRSSAGPTTRHASPTPSRPILNSTRRSKFATSTAVESASSSTTTSSIDSEPRSACDANQPGVMSGVRNIANDSTATFRNVG